MHEKLLWFNENIQYMFHQNIVEYDMKAASVSVCERFHLLDEQTIEQMKLMPKKQRTVKMGNLQKDKEFSEKLISGIKEMRRKFLETNGLDESNVLSLHSDAVLCICAKKIQTSIEGVEFRPKGTWNSFVRYGKLEMLYDGNYITYKGIPKEMLKQHTMGINRYLMNVFDKLENYDETVFQFLSSFQTEYLQDKLAEYYYLPFGTYGDYKMHNLPLFAYMTNIALAEVKTW